MVVSDAVAALIAGLALLWFSRSSRLDKFVRTLALSMAIVTLGGVIGLGLAGGIR